MGFVLDASVTAAWLLPDETHPLADRCRRLLAEQNAVVPGIWWFEIRNLLIVAERRGRLNESGTARALRDLGRFPILRDDEAEEAAILLLARKYRLSFYDAAYLELAMRQDLPLATLDKQLVQAARNETVPLFQDSA